MKKEKAYKILALQENISNKKAKSLIDRGLVSFSGKKVKIARKEFEENVFFNLQKIDDIKIIFEDENILVLDKPPFLDMDDIKNSYEYQALHRLDKQTSGVLILTKNELFRQKAIEEFKKQNVYKEYLAVVSGVIDKELKIDSAILLKKKEKARAIISKKYGKKALSIVSPINVLANKYTKLKVIIKTGRTHQIRIHLSSIAYPVLGDEFYGGDEYKRIMLHSHKMRFLNYEFTSQEPVDFNDLVF